MSYTKHPKREFRVMTSVVKLFESLDLHQREAWIQWLWEVREMKPLEPPAKADGHDPQP